jgi:hypothetical protein
VIHAEVPLRHDFFQLAKAERIPQTPADTQNDDLGFEMSPLENPQAGSAS